jgi:pyruvate dehydrogenase E2 component (dihydrolipoamide acetyltransferase)
MDVRVPDIGGFKDVPVIEVLVKPGDVIAKDAPLVVLESEKASMEVPSDAAGIVEGVSVKVGDKVSQGSTLITLRQAQGDAEPVRQDDAQAAEGETIELRVPDIGDFKDVPVVEVLIKAGESIAKDAPLAVLESEKASMEIPAATAGTVVDVKIKAGDRVSQGTVLATLRTQHADAPASAAAPPSAPATAAAPTASAPTASAQTPAAAAPQNGAAVHAGPSVRRFARELGVDLAAIAGSGPHGRVTREDVQQFVKTSLSGAGTAQAGWTAALPAWPKPDFAQYGPVERKPLSRIKRLSGPNLHRNWLQIPHITNYDEADVTELEAFRGEINAEQGKRGGPKLTMLAFLTKASVAALMRFPEFNASLDGDELIYKNYYNIGFAADTPGGLVVPVIKNADRKGLLGIAAESAELAAKARDGKLALGDMQGGTFTISSIGGIGGTAFTQIVNAPEVAILGAVRTTTKAVWNGSTFVPRLMLPISVSYDHRVVDGAGAARFLAYIAALLSDFRRISL